MQGEDLTAVRLAYAQHVYSAQGRTVDEVYVVTGGWQTDRASGYVGVSRARDASYVVSDRSSLDVDDADVTAALDELGARLHVRRPKTASIATEPGLEADPIGPAGGAAPRSTSAEAIASLSERWTWTTPGTAPRAIADAAADRLRAPRREVTREDLTVRGMSAAEWRAHQSQRTVANPDVPSRTDDDSESRRRAALDQELEEMERRHRQLARDDERDRGLER